MNIPECILVDKTNFHLLKDALISEIKSSKIVGVDIETMDVRRHEGFNRLMKVDDDGKKSSTTKLVFDTNRTDITGFSIYCDESPYAYYINLLHADVENRLPWEDGKTLLDSIDKERALTLAHNAPYELTMLRKSLGYDLGKNVVCTMQLAVSAFNDDTYSVDEFRTPSLGEIPRLFGAVNREFAAYERGATLTNEQAELVYKVTAKESTSAHCYMGYIKELCYSYGLKKLSSRFLGYTQTTFDQVLNGKAHMGQLTGDEVVKYGADDAWVCVRLYHKLMDYLLVDNPGVIETFFSQENPMIHVFSQVWGNGVRIDLDAVKKNQALERSKVAETLRTMKAAVRSLLPYPEDVHEKLVKYDEKGYGKSHKKYRDQVAKWALSPDSADDFTQLYQVKSALSKQWAEEKGLAEPNGMSINYYQVIRSILLDLCRCSFQLSDGKIQADGDARLVMLERWKKKEDEIKPATFKNVLTVLECYKQLAESEQVIKLFINSYLNLTDPETGRVYPSLSSLLNSRRMALATPNLSQLPKFGGTAYVRSFFQPDEPGYRMPEGLEPEEHVMVSADWSSVELVLIGDQSGDPGFAEAFGQIPFGDMHTGTAADLLAIPLEEFKQHPNKKQLRTDVGKAANFGYFYSGGLGTVARELGLSSEEMWEFVDRYRTRYQLAENWRVNTIQTAREQGYVILPDGHKRIRFESTPTWASIMRMKFEPYGDTVMKFGDLVIKKIQTRSGNQAVNSMIQGTCATLAKRSILRMEDNIKKYGFDARFMYPVHDELVYSVRKSHAVAFMKVLKETMCNHPDIVTRLKLDASLAVGLNYQAYHPETNRKGQCELDEASKLPCLPEDRWGQQLTDEERQLVVDYLCDDLKVAEPA